MQTLAKYKKICYHKQADFDNDKKRPHGQAVKTLPSHGRICGSIPHGATKKERHPRDVVLFWYTPKRNDAATCLPSFVNLRKQILAVVLRFTKVKSFRKSMQTETATSAWGYTTSLRGNDAATCLPSFVNLRKQILAVGSHRPHICFPVSYIWETATSAWGYTTSVRGTTRQLVCRRSSICASKFLPRNSVLRKSRKSE